MNPVTYTGNGTTQSITNVNFQPDFVWVKSRNFAEDHQLTDSVRGATKVIQSNLTAAESTMTGGLTAFNADGFSVGNQSDFNYNNDALISWNWKAGGTAPAQTYSVKVVSDGGNKYRFDDFGTSAVTIDLQEGGTYTFDQSDSSNSGHPIRFSTTSDGTHGGGSEYTTGVTVTGTPGNAGAKTVITVAASAPTLYYYCTVHSGMGGQANTNTTFGSSNFSGSIQSTVSANTTAGFSIISWGGTDANGTVGHGLGEAPKMVLFKTRGVVEGWATYHASLGATGSLPLNTTAAFTVSAYYYQNTNPSSTVITVGAGTANKNTPMIAYAFTDVKGYSKFGSYIGNGNADGTFVYTGFKPAFIMVKNTQTSVNAWNMFDSTRSPFNVLNARLYASADSSEGTGNMCDFLSNGVKFRNTDSDYNSANTFIYMAFAENPLVANTSGGIPTTAR